MPKTVRPRRPSWTPGDFAPPAGPVYVERALVDHTAHPALRRAALVLGGAETVWRDLLVLETMVGGQWPGIILAVNDLACRLARPFGHWVTIHPEKLRRVGDGWEKLRAIKGYPGGYQVWSHNYNQRRHGVGAVRQWGSGSSGLLAVTVAYELGCPKVVLCGVPMDQRPHFAESVVHKQDRDWTGPRSHRKAWVDHEERIRERTRSLSGWTRQLLGPPTLEWLTEED